MPGTFLIPPGETVIVAEVWFIGSGFFLDVIASQPTYYHIAVVRPRGVGATELTS